VTSVQYSRGLLAGTLDVTKWHQGTAWITVAACVLACAPSGLRWLRVAQREHYLPGSVVRFAGRWWRTSPANGALAVVALAAGVSSLWWPLVGIAVAAVVVAGPIGLSWKGRTSPLAWTRRLRTLAGTWAVLEAALVVVGVVTGWAAPLAVLAALSVPLMVDVACVATAPLERRLSNHFVDEASARLARIAPTVVAVTGSYGKTSTKGHIAHLLRPDLTVVATPASFNNRAGLARAVNEHLGDGTGVFVAEMGTYGPGEIADLCRWCRPDISVITAIGPVHLERFGSEDRIVEAKSEILRPAEIVVLAVDDPRLAALADREAERGKRVLRCSVTNRAADVCVERKGDDERVSVFVDGTVLAEDVPLATGVQPSNLACAIAVALALGVQPSAIVARLTDLSSVDHRLQAVRSPSGVTILDDTYNSNPAGAAEALAALAGSGPSDLDLDPAKAHRRRVVVTPGMVELGSQQFEENRRLGAAIAPVADQLLIVGRTNRRALLAGVGSVPGIRSRVMLVRDRHQAVEWVRSELVPGDAVLYENDLPDHYP
jgi:UDP-N-acetylmuramoyl-tripeptide--D-alanyl-D-alanine ligase